MIKTAVISFKDDPNAGRIADFLDAQIVEYSEDCFGKAFSEFGRLVALMSVGIVVRKLSPLLKDKWVDPAVVVVSPDMRFAISVLGGHHGANELAKELSGLGLTPVITTATEALGKPSVEELAETAGRQVLNRNSTKEVNAAFLKGDVPIRALSGPAVLIADPGVSILVKKGRYVVGIGCNRGVSSEEVTEAVSRALSESGVDAKDIFVYATTTKKMDEPGLLSAVRTLGGNLVFVGDEEINSQAVSSRSKAEMIGLIGVSEPSALAVSRSKELIFKRRAYGNVTVAIAA